MKKNLGIEVVTEEQVKEDLRAVAEKTPLLL